MQQHQMGLRNTPLKFPKYKTDGNIVRKILVPPTYGKFIML